MTTTHTRGAADLPEALREVQIIQSWCEARCLPLPSAGDCVSLAVALAAGQAVAPAEPEPDPADEWRRLALQFDGHRMQAIGVLKLINHSLKGGAAFAMEKIPGDIATFLAAPPLSGEQVLATRIAEIATTRPAPPAMDGGEDAARLDFLVAQRAYVVSDEDCCDGYWLHYVKPDGATWVQISDHATPRAAIDAAMTDAARAAQKEGDPT